MCGGLRAAGGQETPWLHATLCVSVCMCGISSSMETQRTQLQWFEHSARCKLIQNLEFPGSRGREDDIHTCLTQVALPGSWRQVPRPTSPWTKPKLRKQHSFTKHSLHASQPEFPHTVILQRAGKAASLILSSEVLMLRTHATLARMLSPSSSQRPQKLPGCHDVPYTHTAAWRAE